MGGRMVRGWYSQEGWETWRWTATEFAVEFPYTGGNLVVDLHVPEAMGSATLSVQANGVALPDRHFSRPGDHCYLAQIPAGVATAPLLFEFQLNRVYHPGNTDERELGVVVSRVAVLPGAEDSSII